MLVLYVWFIFDGCFSMHCRVSNPFTVCYTVINKVGATSIPWVSFQLSGYFTVLILLSTTVTIYLHLNLLVGLYLYLIILLNVGASWITMVAGIRCTGVAII